MFFPQKVKATLWSIIDSMALNLSSFVKNPEKDFSRHRKFCFEQLIRFCLCMQSGCINHELLKYFFFNPDEVPSASAFIQQRAKLLPYAFQHILEQFNHKFSLRKFRDKYFIIAADGCEFNIARNPFDHSTFHPSNKKSKRGFNMIHTISLYDLLSKRYLDLVVQPGRIKNEYLALCQLMDRYAYGGCPIVVADRGFSSYNVFAHAMEKGAFFVIRAKDINTKRILGWDSLPQQIDQWAEVILTRTTSKKKRLHPELNHLYRFVCKNVPFDFITEENPEYHMKLRVLRFQIAEGVYENIITNLPDDEFDMATIKDIYKLRFGIETSFRDLKHTIGTANFHSKSPEYIEFEILCRMILYNFCTIITMEVPLEKNDGKWEYQVNLSMAIKICFAYLSDHVSPGNVNGLIRQYILPIRPDRTFPRLVRFQAPASFAYRFV